MCPSCKLFTFYACIQVLKSSPEDAVDPVLINLSVRLRNLQVISYSVKSIFLITLPLEDNWSIQGVVPSFEYSRQNSPILEYLH